MGLLRLFSSHRKNRFAARCEYLHLIKKNSQQANKHCEFASTRSELRTGFYDDWKRGFRRATKLYVPANTLQTIYKALVQPYFDYGSPLWDNCGKILKVKLQKCQSRVARVITGASYNIRSVDVLDTLSWETLDAKRSYNKSVFMYKILYSHTAQI